jgi:diguanylate cyclase (GGDEF)-like protein/PAS domain S-box-containing protein
MYHDSDATDRDDLPKRRRRLNFLSDPPIVSLRLSVTLMMHDWQLLAIAALTLIVSYLLAREQKIRRETKTREELFQIVTENAAYMIALVDVKGNRLYNSPAYRRVLGYSAAELGGTSGFDQIHPDDRFKVLEAAREARATGVGKKLEYRMRHKNGTWRVLESIAGTIRDDNGDVAKLVIVNRDVTQRKQAEELAEHNSFHDGLTGLPNRRLFLDRLHQFFERSQRNPERRYALLFLDLDGFKDLNSTLGPAAADKVIVEISARIASCLRDEDTVSRPQNAPDLTNSILSRMGGGEFAILMEGITDPSDAMRAGQRILSTVGRPLILEGRELRNTASIGIALSGPEHAQAEELLQEADVAIRRAQALGGSRCELFDEAMHVTATNRLKLESELRHAILGNEFRVYYQPVVDLRTKNISGFEALLRWQHPEQGLISPSRFLEVAEDTGLLAATGQWLMKEACRQLRTWDEGLMPATPIAMSFNISPKQLSDPGFFSDMKTILAEFRLDASRVSVEISERVAEANSKLRYAVLSQLRHSGVGIVLDDFGTGRSSLSLLRLLPISVLKIDRQLVSGMLTDHNVYETVDLILTLADKLKLAVIAEGIETAKHWELLQQLGCGLGQGYFISQPVDAEAAGRLLKESSSARQVANAATP